MTEEKSIVFFDGVCNLCNSSVQFIIKKDHLNRFQFASLQSDFAVKFLSDFPEVKKESVLLYQNGDVYSHSTAALKIAANLKFPYSVLRIFLLIPKFIRDFFYNLIARYRYSWFGKRESCMVPDENISNKFLS